MTIKHRYTTVLVLLGLACTTATDPPRQVVELRADRPSYGVGDTLQLTLTNHGPEAVGPGSSAASLFCRVEVEREQASAWQHVATLGGVCNLVGLPPLEEGASVQKGIAITPEPFAAPGSYRLSVRVGVQGPDPFPIRSNGFTVTPDLR